MALEKFIADQLRGVERFLADPDQIALEIERAPDLAIMAGKVIMAGQDDADSEDVYIALDHPFDTPESWSRAVVEAVQASLTAAEPALAEQAIELELPAGMDEDATQLPIELRLLAYLETVARELSPWTRTIVLLWDPGAPLAGELRDAWVGFASRLFAATGSGRVKWVVFSEPGHLTITGLPAPRPRMQSWADSVAQHGDANALAGFVADPLARLLSYRGDARAVEWFRGQFVRSNHLGQRQTILLVSVGEAFLSPLWFFRVCARSIAEQLRELEQHNFGDDQRLAPFVEQLAQSVGFEQAEWRFLVLVERMLDTLVKPGNRVVLLLAPAEQEHAEGLQESLIKLARACVRPELSLIVVDPRVPEQGLEAAAAPIACQRFDLNHSTIADGLREAVADPELPDAARVPYMAALAGLAVGAGDPQKALEHAVAAVAAARERPDPAQLAVAQYVLGNSLYHATGFDLAEQAYAESVDLAITADIAVLAAQAMLGLGNCRFVVEDFDGARDCYTVARTYFAKFDHRLGQVQALTWLAEAAVRKQDWQTGRAEFEHALELCDSVDPNYGELRDNSKIEVLLRLARLFETAGLDAEATARRGEAQRLGAIVEPEMTPS